MDMKRVYNVAIVVVVAIVATLSLSCSNENDSVLISQQTSISRYLTSSHQPKLIAESEVPSSLDSEPNFYTQWGLDIYRYIDTYYAEGRDEWSVVEANSTISIVYTAYVFAGSRPSAGSMYATNDSDSIAELEALGLNTEYEWTTDPMVVKLGEDEILPGLETALVGCREGDSVEIYLTFDEAYGNNYVGSVLPKSAVVWYVDIVDVE